VARARVARVARVGARKEDILRMDITSVIPTATANTMAKRAGPRVANVASPPVARRRMDMVIMADTTDTEAPLPQARAMMEARMTTYLMMETFVSFLRMGQDNNNSDNSNDNSNDNNSGKVATSVVDNELP